ncbi:MAG: T9SS type A sorting domain-containing protein [Phaeodactylibacter sp.]|nr:T9SS type A sorting domain-containing protein [Phaeodactylibacter sp.]
MKKLKHTILPILLLLSSWSSLHAQFPCFNGIALIGPNGDGPVDLCQDGQGSRLNFTTNLHALPIGYLVVDENDVIVYIGLSGTIDFGNFTGNSFRVYGFNFIGPITAEAGDPFGTPLAGGCYALTANSIAVSGDALAGGTVSTQDGDTEAYTCPGDGLADVVQFDSAGVAAGASFVYIVTDENNIITNILNGDSADFENDSTGVSRVWGLSYQGNLTAMIGDNASATSLADGCFSLSENYVAVYREEPKGGMVSTEEGAVDVLFCAGGSTTTLIRFDSTDTGNSNYAYIVTDTNNVILFISDTDEVDFDSLGSDICRAWGLAYTGTLTAMVGDTAGVASLSDGCFALSENYVTVDKNGANGGMVSTEGGASEAYTCPNDMVADTVRFDTTGVAGDFFQFLLTDTSDVILALPDTNFVDFEAYGPGIYRVWGLAYNGMLTAMAGDTASTTTLSDDCFALSASYLTIYHISPEAGMVQTEDGDTVVYTCPGDSLPDIVQFDSTGVTGGAYTYLVTDENNVIQLIPASDSADFDSLPVGNYRVWGLAYNGMLTAAAGDTASTAILSDACFGLSGNYITIYRETPEGGMVALENGATTAYVCPGDSIPDILQFDSTGTGNSLYAYIVTDTNDVVLSIPATDEVDFDSAAIGECRVWGLAYTGTLTVMPGDSLSAAMLADGCYGLSGNYITVIKEQPEGGSVLTESGQADIYFCTSGGPADVVRMDSSGTSNTAYVYLVTDSSNIITSVAQSDEIALSAYATGQYRIWGLAYTGTLSAQAGDDAGSALLSDGCFSLSGNYVSVVLDAVAGGTVSTESGATAVSICLGTTPADTIRLDSIGAGGERYAFVLTDTNNVILDLPAAGVVLPDSLGAGLYRAWGLAYNGNLTAAIGDTASLAILADSCFALSENYVTLEFAMAAGGTISTASGDTAIFLCVGNNQPDTVFFDSTGVTTGGYTYLVTDTNNVILDILSGDSYDFDSSGVGTSRVWGLAYTGMLTAMAGDTASIAVLSDACYSLSGNYVTLNLEGIDGGTVQTEAGQTQLFICPGNGIADVVHFDSLGIGAGAFTYLITDENNVILEILSGDSYDFEPSGIGALRVWGLVYDGNLTAAVGDIASSAMLADGCYSLSGNYVTVIRDQPQGGSVGAANGDTVVYTCPGDGMADVVSFDASGASSSPYVFILADSNNVIIELLTGNTVDFEGDSLGVSYIWGLAYTGNLTAMAGDTLTSATLSDDCYGLSDNFVTVYHEAPEGGTISTASGQDTVSACVSDGLPDLVQLDSTGVGNSQYTYILTDTSNLILSILTGDVVDFDGTGGGINRIWGLAYTGTLTAMPGDTASAAMLSDDCFDLSGNFITVIKESLVGGRVFSEDEEVTLYTCPGDSMPDTIKFDSIAVIGGAYTYLVTDTNNVILTIPDQDFEDFESYGIGVSRVWGLAYNGMLTAMAGDTLFVASLADECYALSTNYITVYRDIPDGGTVSTPDSSMEINACTVANLADVILADSMSVVNSLFAYVITDTNNVILLPPSLDLSGFGSLGISPTRVWAMAYTGNITAMVGDTATIAALSDDCYDLSDNFILANLEEVDGGLIRTTDQETVTYVCPGDGNADVLYFENYGVIGANYALLLTDTSNVVIGTNGGMDPTNFEGLGVGITRVWGLAYSDSLLVMPGDTVGFAGLASGCYDLSENYVAVNQDVPYGGHVMTEDGDTIVVVTPGDGFTDWVYFDSAGVSNSRFVYLLTDSNDVIIQILDEDVFNFENSGQGPNHVWGLAYTGTLTAMAGDTATLASLSDDCFSLSDNYIAIMKATNLNDGPSTEAQPENGRQALAIELWPIPVAQTLRVNIGQEPAEVRSGGTGRLEILDQGGRVVLSRAIEADAESQQLGLDVENLQPGFYMIRCNTGREVKTVRFLKQ